jgi:hypothetical protein
VVVLTLQAAVNLMNITGKIAVTALLHPSIQLDVFTGAIKVEDPRVIVQP